MRSYMFNRCDSSFLLLKCMMGFMLNKYKNIKVAKGITDILTIK